MVATNTYMFCGTDNDSNRGDSDGAAGLGSNHHG